MVTPGRLIPAIERLEAGDAFFAVFAPADTRSAQAAASGPHDAVIFDMEHAPWDAARLRDSLQYLLDRADIAQRGASGRRSLRSSAFRRTALR